LLVVTAILGILMAMTFPVIAEVRDSVRTTICLSNTKQLSAAVLVYAQDYDDAILPWASCAPKTPGYAQPCSGDASSTALWTDTIQPYVKGRQSLLCLSFQPIETARAMDEATCDGDGTAGSASAKLVPADFYTAGYGLAYPLTLNSGCDKSGSKPYARYPGSGWTKDFSGGYVYHLQTLGGVISPARTAIVGDGLTYQSHNADGPFVGTLFGCEGRGRHKGGATLGFLDGHSKWISEDPEQVLEEDKDGCLFERYYAADK